MEFNIPAISCGHCVRVVTDAIRQGDAAAQVDVDLASKKVTVQSTQKREALVAALDAAGYPTD